MSMFPTFLKPLALFSLVLCFGAAIAEDDFPIIQDTASLAGLQIAYKLSLDSPNNGHSIQVSSPDSGLAFEIHSSSKMELKGISGQSQGRILILVGFSGKATIQDREIPDRPATYLICTRPDGELEWMQELFSGSALPSPTWHQAPLHDQGNIPILDVPIEPPDTDGPRDGANNGSGN